MLTEFSNVTASFRGGDLEGALESLSQTPQFQGRSLAELQDMFTTLQGEDVADWGRRNAEILVDFEARRLSRPIPRTTYRAITGEVRASQVTIEDRAPLLMALPDITLPVGAGLLATSDGRVLRTRNDDVPDFMERVPNVVAVDEARNTVLCRKFPPARETFREGIYINFGSKYFAIRLLSLAAIATAREVIRSRRIPFIVEAKFAPGPVEVEAIRSLGFKYNEIIPIQKGAATFVERLWFPFLPTRQSIPFVTSSVATDLFRKHLGVAAAADASKGERIYISRQDAPWRKVANEDEVLQVLARYGFRTVQFGGRSASECMKELRNAQVIVGLTGSSLVNALFAPPGAWLIEMTPREYDDIGFRDYGAAIYASFRQNVIQTLGEPTIDLEMRRTRRDIIVSCEELKVAIEFALARIDAG